MNLLKYVTGYFMGQGGAQELVQINGSLYDRYKGAWRCLFNDCTAVVRRTNNAFIYELVVSRVETEDEPENDEEDEEENTYVFTIVENMIFAKDSGPVTNGFSWTDTTSSKRYLLELEDESSMSSLFQLTVCQCIYEAKNNKPSTDVPSEVALRLCGTPPQETVTPTPTKSPLYPSLKEAPTTPSTPYASYPYQNNSLPSTPASQQPKQQTPQTTPKQTPQKNVFQTPQQTPQPDFSTPSKTPQQTPQQTPQKTPQQTPQKTPQQTPQKTPQQTPQNAFMNKLQSPVQSTSTAHQAATELPTKYTVSTEGETIYRAPTAELYVYDESSQSFILKQSNVEVLLNDTSDEEQFAFKLYVLANKEVMIGQSVDSDMLPHHDQAEHSFVWVYNLGSLVWTWSLKFPKEVYEEFQEAIVIALWEVNNNTKFKIKVAEEKAYLINSLAGNNGTNPNDISLEEDDGTVDEVDLLDFEGLTLNKDEEQEEEEEAEEEEEEDEEDEDYGSEDENMRDFNSQSHNSSMAVGTQSARSFVVRGSQIGVFKTDAPNLKLVTSIKKVKDREGKFFSPKKLVLSEQDQSLLMLHPNQKNKLFKMDLNRSDIVEEWKVSDYYPVNEVVPTTKYAQTTPAKTVVGMNEIGFFLIDPRLNKEKMVENKSYFYSNNTKPLLSCAATTDTGAVVVGTKKGEIRLFDSKTFGDGRQSKADSLEARAPRAKTTLPGLGDPIIGIDVTEDGRWVLATCRTYIIVVPTDLPGGNNGFEKAMGKFKPVPRRLALKREDLVKMGGKVSFTVAKFNTKDPTNPNAASERSIVTSSGRFVITWNFKKVKQGILDQYNIQEYADVVVADQFKFGEDKKVIVTLPDDVLMTKRTVRKVA